MLTVLPVAFNSSICPFHIHSTRSACSQRTTSSGPRWVRVRLSFRIHCMSILVLGQAFHCWVGSRLVVSLECGVCGVLVPRCVQDQNLQCLDRTVRSHEQYFGYDEDRSSCQRAYGYNLVDDCPSSPLSGCNASLFQSSSMLSHPPSSPFSAASASSSASSSSSAIRTSFSCTSPACSGILTLLANASLTALFVLVSQT